ncbi:MAG: DoxX family protein [Acidiferrobacterales bacterium]|nr:DoxX family protein [Acidiferrobacterales bacterium]
MIPVDSFDLSNGAVILRLACALFFIPHMYFKAVGNPPPASKTFIDAGYPKPLLFVRLALVVELFACAALFLNIYTQYVALIVAAVLMVAVVTVYFANGKQFIWLWVKGGCEYPAFWAVMCIALSMLYWQ